MNPEENKDKKPIKALRTFAGDVEEALSKGKSSSATIMIAEQKRREERPELAPPKIDPQTKNKTFFAVGIFLLILSVVTIGGIYYYINMDQRVYVDEKSKSLISSSEEKSYVLTGTSEQFLGRLASEKDSSMTINTVINLKIVDQTNTTVKTEDLLKFVSKKIPGDLSRSFDDKYMLGIYAFDTNEPFIVLKTSDYPTSYAGMLKWEKDMAQDLSILFSIPVELFGVGFVDEEFKNKDLRILKNNNGRALLVYSFVDKNTLIITSNENIFSAILGKYMISTQIR